VTNGGRSTVASQGLVELVATAATAATAGCNEGAGEIEAADLCVEVLGCVLAPVRRSNVGDASSVSRQELLYRHQQCSRQLGRVRAVRP
jgi:hypothetical protein